MYLQLHSWRCCFAKPSQEPLALLPIIMQVDTWQERLITWTMIFVGNLTKKFGRKAMATDGPAVFIVGLVGAALASDS